ncbi:hypothetical protein IV203_010097 [Nitzschia inconspicua]|uniref:Uncharacterized protein n=1 Tax=Nitzschia inconspicua TaxID=303405 RepID=A0A9K3KWE3_9STRA|nr:hypothetical protein IV203_033507 [Nitzschia inconspicua]KAG7338470.1 hypothetical protein IV203_011025 [Nitzschia inconspicua]KAG7350737.1 hypothetical protein IV203_010097 [Nitzschia inconspicua]
MMARQRYAILLCIGVVLSPPTLAWNPLKRQQNRVAKATSSNPPSVSSSTVSLVDSRLFYRNDCPGIDTQDLLPSPLLPAEASSSHPSATTPTTVAVPFRNHLEPRFIDLPFRPPSREVLQRRKLMLDVEMMIGRLAMVTALVLFANEIVTGSSLMDQIVSHFVG